MEKNISHHQSVNQMYDKVQADGMTNIHDRFTAQGNRCTYCSQGLTCSLCSMGPCRIKPNSPQGVCGIEADAMAMRRVLHQTLLGISAYTYHANEVAKTLKATAAGKTPFTIKEPAKLKAFAKQLGLNTNVDDNTLAAAVADFLIAEINRDSDSPSKMVEIFAPAKRKELWRKLGIFPGGPLHELMCCGTSSMTNVDTDYVSLALKTLRLGIACTYGSLVGLEMVQDILFGTASPHKMPVDLGVLDPAYVNILPNGHEPFVGTAILQAAKTAKFQELAKAAGAKGIHVIGSIETGQEMIQRYPQDEVMAGFTGNWLNQEYAIATGAVDLFAVDMNCSVATLGKYAQKYGGKIVAVSKLVAVPEQSDRINYDPTEVAAQAAQLIEIAIANFKERQGKPTNVPPQKREAIVGFSTEAILGLLGNTLEPLLSLIKDGTIKGVTALISCTTLGNGPQDSNSIAMAKELIKNDILVIAAGCGNGAMQVGGLCSLEAAELAGDNLKAVCQKLGIPPVLSFGTCTDTGRIALLVTAVADALGVDTCDLPIAVTAPEYMEQKAVIDAFFAVAFGLYTHVSPVPFVTGAPALVKLLTADVENVTGGKVAVGDDMQQAAQGIIAHINKKRQALGI